MQSVLSGEGGVILMSSQVLHFCDDVWPNSIFIEGKNIMSKSQDTKKEVKKQPAKTQKEKKEAKRAKKEAMKRQ